MDNHNSHLTIEFVKYCEEYNILLLPISPHSTHRLQPLDSVPFQQLKEAHSAKVNEASRFRGERYKKVEFLYVFLAYVINLSHPLRSRQAGEKQAFGCSILALSCRKWVIRQMMIRIYCKYMTGAIQLRILKSFLRLMPLLPPIPPPPPSSNSSYKTPSPPLELITKTPKL
jgi:hypothetical protein